MYKHILVPTDGSALSLKAARAAAALARPLKARITAIYVMQPFRPTASDAVAFGLPHTVIEYEAGARKTAEKALAKVATAAGGNSDTVSMFHDQPWQAIVATAAKQKCDLIVMASHGRRGLSALLLGSETQKVLTHSKTPVLVCR